MNDEIKEILDKLKETADYPKLNYSSYDKSYNETIDNVAMIKSFACKQLLDYITILQEEIKRLKQNQSGFTLENYTRILNDYNELKELEEEHRRINGGLRKQISDTIELINSLIIFWKKYSPDNTMIIGQLEKLLYILQGNDE